MQRSLIYIVPTQPRRDTLYKFRTHITRPNSNYDLFHPDSILTQIIIYRMCHNGQMISGVAIDDLHSFISYDLCTITKKRMGDVVINSVIYNPRKLKGVTKNNPEKAKMIYVFEDILDLQYGLEWQICSWLWKLLRPATEDDMEHHLRNIVNFSMEKISDVYISRAAFLHKINWMEVWRHQGLFNQEELLMQPARKERPALKSLL